MTSDPWRRFGRDAALLAALLAGATAVCRMIAGGIDGPAAAPVLITTVVGWVVPTTLLRRRAPVSAALAAGALGVALGALWTTVPRATAAGFPTMRTLHVVRHDFRAARADLASFRVPLHPSPGVVLLAAVVAGMTGVAARVTLGNERAGRSRLLPAVSLSFPLALVAWSAIADGGIGSAVVVAVFAAVAAVEVALSLPAPTPATGRSRRRRSMGMPGAGAVTAGLAVVAALSVGIALGTPGGASTVSPGPGVAAAVPPTALSLASDLVGLERTDPSVVLFSARTPFATYWQVGVLTEFRGDAWVPDPATTAALRGKTVAVDEPDLLPTSSHRAFAVTVTIDNLSSRLFPVPPTTERVAVPERSGHVDVTGIGAVGSAPTARGERYRATAIVPPAVSVATAASAAGALSGAQLRSELTLPPVPAVVVSLARQVTARATTPLARAEALVNWFRSGLFRYTLTPPPAPAGSDALTSFLTTTRAGTCESFAGAFAVMARVLGLPARVAVGFTGGRASSHGTTIIRGADAHAWPVDYLGASSGWVSFEPTPELPSGELAPPSVVGPTGIPVPPNPGAPPTRTPRSGTRPVSPTTTPPTTTPVTTPVTRPVTSPTTAVHRSTARAAGAAFTDAGVGLGSVVVLFCLCTTVVWWRRRRRRHVTPPGQRVLAAYRHADRALAAAGMARPVWRTPPDHARSLLSDARDAQGRWSRAPWSVTAGDELEAALGEVLGLSLILERVYYGPEPATSDDAMAATAAARRIRRSLRHRPVRALADDLGTGDRPDTARRHRRRPSARPRRSAGDQA